MSGADPLDFSPGDDCPVSLAPAATCTFNPIFTPQAAGTRTASIVITDNGPGGSQSIALTATGVAAPPPAPAVTFVPGSVNFATSIPVGSSSTPTTITLTSSGTAPLSITGAVISGSNPGDFQFVNSCGVVTPPVNSSCTMSVTLVPQAVGLRTATLDVSTNESGSPQSVNLSGTGTAPLVTFLPGNVGFATSIPVGENSSATTVTVTNAGTAPLNISGVAIAGTNPGDFKLASNACATVTLQASQSCTVGVTFAPQAVGTRTATLTVSDNAVGSPQGINLSGTGSTPFLISSTSGGSPAATVAAGQPATYNLQLTPAAGFTGTVSFACTGAPLGATCTLSMTSTQGRNGAPATIPITASVTTTAASTSVNFPSEAPANGWPGGWPNMPEEFGAMTALLALAAIAAMRSAGMLPAKASARIIFATAMLLGMALLGCGNSGGSSPVGNPSSTATPAGNYSLTVTASGSGITQQETLTLTVHYDFPLKVSSCSHGIELAHEGQ
jgi:hypothetical protein